MWYFVENGILVDLAEHDWKLEVLEFCLYIGIDKCLVGQRPWAFLGSIVLYKYTVFLIECNK